MDNPLVSIITPLLNTMDYLEKSISSVLSQDYQNIEHLFVDGGSTDGSLELVKSYETKFPNRIRVIDAPKSNVPEAWDIGYKNAKGLILGSIGADDTCEPETVSKVVDYFTRNKDASVVQGHCDIINTKGSVIMRNIASEFNIIDFINTAYYVATPSVYYKREVIEEIGGLEISGDDFDVMIRMAQLHKFHPINHLFSKLLVREGTAFRSKDFAKRKKFYYDTYLVSKKYGGSRFSPLAKRYYIARLIELLKMERFFPLIRQFYRWVRRIPMEN